MSNYFHIISNWLWLAKHCTPRLAFGWLLAEGYLPLKQQPTVYFVSKLNNVCTQIFWFILTRTIVSEKRREIKREDCVKSFLLQHMKSSSLTSCHSLGLTSCHRRSNLPPLLLVCVDSHSSPVHFHSSQETRQSGEGGGGREVEVGAAAFYRLALHSPCPSKKL